MCFLQLILLPVDSLAVQEMQSALGVGVSLYKYRIADD